MRKIIAIVFLLSMFFCAAWWLSGTTTRNFFLFGFPAITSVVIFQVLCAIYETGQIPALIRLSVAFGASLNLLVLSLNKGFMPVSVAAGAKYMYGSHCLITPDSKLTL